jgi:hypothetical protein
MGLDRQGAADPSPPEIGERVWVKGQTISARAGVIPAAGSTPYTRCGPHTKLQPDSSNCQSKSCDRGNRAQASDS